MKKMIETMDDNKVIKLPEERCQFCGKREATKLCDKVIGETRAIDMEGPGVISSGLMTCDKKICDKCATHIDGADYCPECVQKIKKALGRRLGK